ncbi:hypothetical protein Tco_0407266 [Tanacetum coccineum]
MQTQGEAQQANELSNLTRQRQLLASVNYRHAIIKDLEHLLGNLVAYKTREHLKRIQKAVLVETGKKELKGIEKHDMIRRWEDEVVQLYNSSDHGIDISNSLSESDKHTSLGKQVYVVPTGRVKVPAGRYVVPTGKDNVIVSAGRSKVIPAGRTILVLVVLCLLRVDSIVS